MGGSSHHEYKSQSARAQGTASLPGAVLLYDVRVKHFITFTSLAMFWLAIEAHSIYACPLALPACILAALGAGKVVK